MPCPPTPPVVTPPVADLFQPIQSLSEVLSDAAVDGAAAGFVAAQLQPGAPVLWIQDRLSQKETGAPYLAGFPMGLKMIRVDISRAVDVLWSMEEGLRCAGLSAVVGEIWGDPPALDFTASKRLALRAEAQKCPVWLIRRAGTSNLSAARNRWRVKSLPSAPTSHDISAAGHPQWHVELFRSRSHKPGDWVVQYDAAAQKIIPIVQQDKVGAPLLRAI